MAEHGPPPEPTRMVLVAAAPGSPRISGDDPASLPLPRMVSGGGGPASSGYSPAARRPAPARQFPPSGLAGIAASTARGDLIENRRVLPWSDFYHVPGSGHLTIVVFVTRMAGRNVAEMPACPTMRPDHVQRSREFPPMWEWRQNSASAGRHPHLIAALTRGPMVTR